MGVEERWQDRVPAWRRLDDRNSWVQQRSRWMLISGSALLLLAMMLARWLPHGPGRSAARPAIAMAPAVVAGATRLSTAPLLGPTMRALAVPVNEVAGISGLVFPGDRVDLFLIRQPDEAMPHADLLAQNIRVLAVGSDMNIAREKPGVVKTVTIEVNPLQAQKLPLAMATGEIRLALRPFNNEARVRLQSLQVRDLNDGTTTRLVRKPGSSPAAAARPPPINGQAKA